MNSLFSPKIRRRHNQRIRSEESWYGFLSNSFRAGGSLSNSVQIQPEQGEDTKHKTFIAWCNSDLNTYLMIFYLWWKNGQTLSQKHNKWVTYNLSFICFALNTRLSTFPVYTFYCRNLFPVSTALISDYFLPIVLVLKYSCSPLPLSALH